MCNHRLEDGLRMELFSLLYNAKQRFSIFNGKRWGYGKEKILILSNKDFW